MSERGEYRSIRRVLINGPDFQQLSERARWTFVCLKLGAGVEGIELWYPDELTSRLTRQVGAPASKIRVALDELERNGWIAREGPVLWIIKHLKNDPHQTPGNAKQRIGVQRHVAGVPRLEIVRRFIAAHPEWFPGDEVRDPARGLAWTLEPELMLRGFDTPSKPLRSTKQNNSNTRQEASSARARVGNSCGKEQPDPESGRAAIPDEYSADVEDLLTRVEHVASWEAEIRAMMTGTPGHVRATAEQIGRAARDYLGNGAGERPNLRQFRRYVEHAVKGETAGERPARRERRSLLEETYENARIATGAT